MSTVYSGVDIGCHFQAAGGYRLINKVRDKTATYLTGNQNERLPVQVASSDAEVATLKREVGARLRLARESLKMSRAELAATYGGKDTGIEANEAGKSLPGGLVLRALLLAGVNSNWVLTGGGDMMLANHSKPGSAFDVNALKMIIYAVLKARDGRVTPEYLADAVADAYERYAADISQNGSKAA